jgi:hypothetical protein
MAKGKLSSGFSGSTTRSASELDREVETRMKKRLDVFTDDFSPPGSFESSKGGDNRKPGFTATPHDDYSQAEDNSRNHDPKLRPMKAGQVGQDGADISQDEMDAIDANEHAFNSPIKKPSSQFPGAKMSKKLMDSPEEFTKHVEAKMDKDEHDKAKVEDAPKADKPESEQHEFDDRVEAKMKKLAEKDAHGEKVETIKKPNGKFVYRINGDASTSAEYDSEAEAMKAAKNDIAVSKKLK